MSGVGSSGDVRGVITKALLSFVIAVLLALGGYVVSDLKEKDDRARELYIALYSKLEVMQATLLQQREMIEALKERVKELKYERKEER
jgi:hypothetical protein